jgi:hypothetical protein
MMNARLSDPHQDVPEDSPDGVWEDPEEAARELPKQVILPARRTLADPPAGGAPQEIGLRIESNFTRSDLPGPAKGLEVQEIGTSVIRLDQTEPVPPKVERQFKFHERPAREKSGKTGDGEGHHWGGGQRYPVRWILGMGGVVTVLVIAIFLLLPAINSANAPKKNPNEGALRVEEEEKVEGMESLNQLLTQQPEALKVFRAYSQASLAEEVVPLIKDGKALESALRSHWDPLRMPSAWKPDADSAWNVQVLAGQPYGVLEGFFPDHQKFSAYFILEEGRLSMDWKATVGFGTATFAQLSQGKGDASEIRGEISPTDYYNAVWPEGEYRSYRLTSPNEEESIWGYARIGDAASEEVVALFNQGEILGEPQNSRKVTLRLVRGAEGSLPNQWLIAEMLHIDWATP